MSEFFTTDQIDRLQAAPLDAPRGWRITFRSGNDGRCHQLYVNGLLADATDTPQQRTFLIDARGYPQELVIAAVDPDSRAVDMSDRLPPGAAQPSWVYRARVVREPRHGPGDRLEVLGDHATGQLDEAPLMSRALCPDWLAGSGFGEGLFGAGGFGRQDDTSPGMGAGAFGAGAFGFGAETLVVRVPLLEEGSHQIVLRASTAEGQHADAPPETFTAHPPPAPAEALTATGYDPQTHTLTLQIQ